MHSHRRLWFGMADLLESMADILTDTSQTQEQRADLAKALRERALIIRKLAQ